MKAIRRASRKAVSPVVATVILVLISVVAGVMLWLWVSGFTSAATAQQPALNERIKIEAVDASTGSLKVHVRNVGGTTVNITKLYVLTTNGVVYEVPDISPTSINPSNVEEISATLTKTYNSGTAYIVKVVTKNGVEASCTFVWP